MENKDIKDIVIHSFREKKNSHAFLFITNNISKCYLEIIDLICKINCKIDGDGNCNCNICKTIKIGNNPDVVILKPDGKEIKTDQVLNVISTFSTKPLINKYSTYIVKECDKLNDSAANKLLKFLEEPEENIIGFYITNNLQGVLPTIKSRCEIYHYHFGAYNILDLLEIDEIDYSNYYDFTFSLVEKLNDNPKYLLMSESKNIAKKERSEISLILNLIKRMYTIKYENLISNKYEQMEYVKPILDIIRIDDVKTIVKRLKIIDNIINDFKINVNRELILNKMFLLWE